MPLLTVVTTMSSSQDFDDSNDSNDSLTKLDTQGIDFRSSQFGLGKEVNVV